MIELKGTLIERLRQAIYWGYTEVSGNEIEQYLDACARAGIRPPASAVDFFRKYGGVFRSSRIALADARQNSAIIFKCYGRPENGIALTDLEYAAQNIDAVSQAAGQDVCPVALIGFHNPADVYIGLDGTLYCLYDFKEEIDTFQYPEQILEYYLRNNMPVGLEERP